MKVQGPMMSIGASGSFAGVLTAATWKGRPYMRQLVVPSNPKSAMQTSTRAMFRFLSQAWATIGDAAQASWESRAASGNYSPFNAYQSYNMDRWARALGPTINPEEPASTPATVDTFTATAGVRSVTLTMTLDSVEDNWGFVLFQEIGSAPEGTQDEVVYVQKDMVTSPVQVLLTDLTPGLVYHYKYKLFAVDGTYAALSSDFNATPTS